MWISKKKWDYMENRVLVCESVIKKMLEDKSNETDLFREALTETKNSITDSVNQIRDAIKEEILESIRKGQ